MSASRSARRRARRRTGRTSPAGAAAVVGATPAETSPGETSPAGSAATGGPARSPASGRAPLRRVEETSAGGLVVDLTGDEPRGALIGKLDRRGRLVWSLPKGHLEAGETAEQAAAREVAEETGISGEVVASLGTIDFWFVAGGRRIHKTVHHFLLHMTGGALSDEDVEVTEVAWVPLPEIGARLAYPDERGLVDTARELLAASA